MNHGWQNPLMDQKVVEVSSLSLFFFGSELGANMMFPSVGKLLIMRLGKYQKTVPKNQRHKGTNQSTAQLN